jgi:membrane-associated phospholipid phosphatase
MHEVVSGIDFVKTAGAALPSLRRPTRRVEATWADIGLHRLCAALWLLNGTMFVAALILFRVAGVHMVWSNGLPIVYATATIGAFWAYFAWQPGASREWIIPEAAVVLMLLLANALVAPPMQYPALALQRPTIDGWLAAGDAALGISVPDVVRWTAGYPALVAALKWSYISLLPQFVAPILLLPIFNDRSALWEYAWHFLICSGITVACLAAFPAAHTFTYQHFTPLLNESRLIEHFATARAGGFTTIDYDHLEGLVSCPSFHLAGAWMVTWAFRRTWLLVPLAILNSLLAASTVMLGAHYAVDFVATAAMIGLTWLLFHLVGRRLLPSRADFSDGSRDEQRVSG